MEVSLSKSFSSVNEFIDGFNNDGDFNNAVRYAYGEDFNNEKITSVFEKSKEGLEDARLKEIAISFYKQRNEAMGLKAAAQKAILFAVYCKGSTMHSRYRLDDGEFVDMVETPEAAGCK